MQQELTESDLMAVLNDLYNSIPADSGKYIYMRTDTADLVEKAMREGNALRRYYRNPIFRNMTQRQVNRATGKVRLASYEPMTAKKRRRRR